MSVPCRNLSLSLTQCTTTCRSTHSCFFLILSQTLFKLVSTHIRQILPTHAITFWRSKPQPPSPQHIQHSPHIQHKVTTQTVWWWSRTSLSSPVHHWSLGPPVFSQQSVDIVRANKGCNDITCETIGSFGNEQAVHFSFSDFDRARQGSVQLAKNLCIHSTPKALSACCWNPHVVGDRANLPA